MDKPICIAESTILVELDLKNAPDVFRKLSWLSQSSPLHPNCPSLLYSQSASCSFPLTTFRTDPEAKEVAVTDPGPGLQQPCFPTEP